MLIKRQEGLRTEYYNVKNIKEMGISISQMGLEDHYIIEVYWIYVTTDDRTPYVARYLEEQDAVNELERFKAAVFNKDKEFEFTRCDKLEKRIVEAKKMAVAMQKQRQEEKQKERDERVIEIKREIEARNRLKAIICYALIFLIYGIVINTGVKYIKSPLALVTAGILAGVVGAAMISYAKGGKEK